MRGSGSVKPKKLHLIHKLTKVYLKDVQRVLINPNELLLKQAADRCQELLSSKKVLVCSKNRLTLAALCLCTPILQSLIGGATTEEEGLNLQIKFNPDLLITSEDLEKGYGIRLVERVKAYNPKITTLIFLGRETTDVVHEAMDAGADGVMFISSVGSGHGDFINALTTTNNGGLYYPKSVRAAATARIKQPPELIDPLSEREREVLHCIIQGMKNSEIAESLFLSSETIKSHVSTTIQKLGVRDRTQAAVFALTHGLVEADI